MDEEEDEVEVDGDEEEGVARESEDEDDGGCTPGAGEHQDDEDDVAMEHESPSDEENDDGMEERGRSSGENDDNSAESEIDADEASDGDESDDDSVNTAPTNDIVLDPVNAFDLTDFQQFKKVLFSIGDCQSIEQARQRVAELEREVKETFPNHEEILRYLRRNYFDDGKLELWVLCTSPTQHNIKTTTQIERLNRSSKEDLPAAVTLTDAIYRVNGDPLVPTSAWRTPVGKTINRYEEGALRRRDPRVITREDRARSLAGWAKEHPAWIDGRVISPAAFAPEPDDPDLYKVLREPLWWKDLKHYFTGETPYYLVDLRSNSCTCPDSRRNVCKHVLIGKHLRNWSFPGECDQGVSDRGAHGPAPILSTCRYTRPSGRTKSYRQLGEKLRTKLGNINKMFVKRAGMNRDEILESLEMRDSNHRVLDWEPRINRVEWKRILKLQLPRNLRKTVGVREMREFAENGEIAPEVMTALLKYLFSQCRITPIVWSPGCNRCRRNIDRRNPIVVARAGRTEAWQWECYILEVNNSGGYSMSICRPLCDVHHELPIRSIHSEVGEKLDLNVTEEIHPEIVKTCSPHRTGMFIVGILRAMFLREPFCFHPREIAYESRKLAALLLAQT
eukprot:gb/GECG01007094.1/.p1 GENE.gb/GECG01007094.1/~~gb/GECG01007094.1/.p1  ORF type:complete len:619 (+),score=69.46 gb/GECG01007094.1/:1-1857(+)